MSRTSERFNRGFVRSSISTRLVSVLVLTAMLATLFHLNGIKGAFAAGNYSAAVLADAPLGYWRLDEGSGTAAADASGAHANPLTHQGGYTLGSYPGAINGDADAAVGLNGTNGAVTAAKTPTAVTTNWSLEAWVKPSTLPQAGVIAYNGQENSNGYGFAIGTTTLTSGSKLVGVVGGVGNFDSGFTFTVANAWYHVVMTRDTTTIRFYVNGVLRAPTSALAPVAPGARFSLGSAFTTTSSQVLPLAGSVDEAASYNKILSLGRILAHFTEGGSAASSYGNWATASPTGPPVARAEPAMAWDPIRNKVVLFGGKNSAGAAVTAETWTWDGTTWTKLTPATQPSARWGAKMAFDTALGKMVLFGGKAGTTALNDTWTWNGTTWASVTTTTKPSVRLEYGLTYDTARGLIVLFGGTSGSAALQDTYTFDGTNWTAKSPVSKPSIRSQVAMDYDTTTSNAVLFGGVNGTTFNAETWTWDGTNWTQKAPSTTPSARANSGLAYNPVTGAEVLLGGVNGSTYLADTWTWDGTNWTLQSPTTSPAVRAGAGFTYNGVAGNDALFAGQSGSSVLSDSLAWSTPPAAPTASAVAGVGQATVTFSTPASGGSAITGYVITPYVGTSPGTARNVGSSPATVTGLANGTTYTFSVFAKNAVGNGPVATTAAITTPTAPGPPVIGTATAGDQSATVTWTAPGNGGSAITGYTVKASTGPTQAAPAGSTSWPFTGLSNGTSYTFTVTATNVVGTGPASAASNAVVPAGLPFAPTGVNASAGAGQATVSWTAPGANGSAITRYTVSSSPATTAQSTPNGSTTTLTFTGLAPLTSYTFTVTATNAVGTGPASAPSTAIVTPDRPGVPTIGTASPGDHSATVTWTAPASNGGNTITGYLVTPSSGTSQAAPASPTSFVFGGLTNGIAYTFTVAAINGVGTGTASAASNQIVPAGVPLAPTNVNVTSVGVNQATVAWTAANANGGSLIRYTVTSSPATTAQNTPDGTTTSLVFTGLAPGTSYTFSVTATNGVGTSVASAPSGSITTPTIPTAPTIGAATGGDTNATVRWTAPGSNGGNAITGYVITPSAGSAQTASASATSLVFTGLTNGTTYTFTVAAVNGVGTGPASAVSNQVVPSGLPFAPTAVAAAAGINQATVSWTAPGSNGSAILRYTVTSSPATSTQSTADGSTTTLVFTGLAAGANYTFTVVAVNANGTGPASAPSNSVTIPTFPSAPTIGNATAGDQSATITWTAPNSDGGSPLTAYVITPSIGSSQQVGPTLNSATFTGLTNGTSYTFTVAAKNAIATGPSSAASNPVIPGGYQTAVLASSPAAYYRLNETSGTVAADSSGNSNSATYNGGFTLGSTGALINGPTPSVSLNGYADVSATSATWLPGGNTDRAVELWFNSTGGINMGQAVFGYGTYGSTGGLVVRVSGTNQIEVHDFQSNPKSSTSYPLTNGKWHHLVVTYGAGTMSVYVDGALLMSYIPALPLATVTSNGFVIGHDFYEGFGGNDPFTGRIDEVAVYTHALDAASVLAHYQASGNLRPAVAGQPTSVVAVAGANQATASWTAASAQVDYPVTSYVITAYQSGTAAGTTSVAGATLTGVVTGLRSGLPYTFTVTAFNSVGFGQASSPSAAVSPSGDADTYVSSVLSDAPLLYYRFDDAAPSLLADSSGNARNGVYEYPSSSVASDGTHPAAVPESADNYLNQGGSDARYFNGTGLPSGSASRTIEAWVKNGSTGTLVGYGHASDNGTFQVQLLYSAAIRIRIGGAFADHVVLLPHRLDGQWHQVVVTYQGTTVRVWEDGIFAGSTALGVPLATSLDADGLAIGRPSYCCTYQESLDGASIDEVAVYDHVLSDARIQDHFAKSGNYRPLPPVSVTATVTAGADNQASVSWTPSTTQSVYPLIGYVVRAVSGSTPVNSVATLATGSSTLITGLAPGAAYTFQVSGVNSFGTGTPGTSNSITTTGTILPYASVILADGPVSYHRLSDAATSIAADSSGNGNDSVIYGGGTGAGAIPSDTGDSGLQSVQPSIRDYAQRNLPLGNTARSLEAWVKPAPNPGMSAVAVYGSNGPSDQEFFGLYVLDYNQVIIATQGNDPPSGHVVTLPYRIDNGTWHQLVATYDGTVLGLYVDGVAVPVPNAGSASPLNTSLEYRGYEIGESPSLDRNYLNGGIDEVAVYPTALSSLRVKAHFDAAGYRRPGAVTDVQVWPGPSQLWVSWTPPADSGTYPLDSYQVSAGGRTFTLKAALSSVTIPDLTGATTVDILPVAGFGGVDAAATGTPDASQPTAPSGPGISVAIGYIHSGPSDGSQVRLTNSTSSDYYAAVAADIGDHIFLPLGFGTVPAGGSVDLGGFDTSDILPFLYPNCQSDPNQPTIYIASLAVAGQDTGRVMAGSFKDSGRIVISGGVDRGNCGGDESAGFQTIGQINSSDGFQLFGNPSAMICGCSAGDPIDDSTGNFAHTFMDLAIPGRGIPLSMGRTYNSLRAPYDGPLGLGWSSHYTMHLAQDIATGHVTVTQENGSTVTYDPPQKNQDGTVAFAGYHAPGTVLASLVHNPDGTWTFKRTDNITHLFNSRGQLIDESDLNGYHTQLFYSSGRLQTVTEPAGRTLTFGYTGSRITSVTDPTSRSVAYHYNASGELDQATDVGGKNVLLGYDPSGSHLLQTMQDPNGGVVTNVYDSYGRVTSQKDPLLRQTTFGYVPAGTTTITDPKGNVTVEKYELGRMVSRTVGFGTAQAATSTYTYDRTTSGVASVTDPNNNVVSYTYDANGNKLTSNDPLHHIRTTTFNGLNEILTNQDPAGLLTTNTYDASGNLTLVSKPYTDGSTNVTVSYTYDPAHAGDVTQVTDSDSKVWTFAYDQYGNPISATDPLGNRASATYDTIGRVQTSVSPRGNATGANPPDFTTSYFYNAYGNRTSVVDPLGHSVQYFYDNDQNLTSTTDPNNHTTATTYNLANEVTIVTRADTSQLKFFYDLDGNLREQDDGLGNPTTYAYDPLNRQTSVTDPLNRVTQLTYDPAGRVLTKVDAMNRTTSFGYDVNGQLTSATYSDGVTPNVTYTYNGIGQRLTMVDGTGTTTYTYDSLHRLKTVTNGAGSVVGYGYDLQGQVTTITYPGTTGSVSRVYDDAGRVHQITDWQGHTTTYNYDADGTLISMAYPNGTTAAFSHDNADRLIGIVDSLRGTPFLNLPLGRDSGGQLTTQGADSYSNDVVNRLHVWTNSGGAATTYQYDHADQLQTAATAGANQSAYTYDVANQLQSLTITDTNSNPVASFSFNFNANGNRVQMNGLGGGGPPTTTYAYDQANRLVNFNSVATYGYSGDAIRMSKTVGGSTTQYTWESIDGLAHLLQDGTTSYVTGVGGHPLEQIKADGTVYYYHQDQVGSTRALTDASGAVVATYNYSPYGTLASSTGTVANPFQWAGEYLDFESGLVYLRSRYYDPATAQFMTSDKGGSGHRYVYASSDPLNRADPNGTMDALLKCGLRGFQAAMGILIFVPGFGEIALAADIIVSIVLVVDDLANHDGMSALGDGIGLAMIGAGAAVGVGLAAIRGARLAREAAAVEEFPVGPSIGELRAGGLKDAHHIIQEAAVRDVPGYETNAAPGVQLSGPSTSPGTPHYLATQAQGIRGVGGTYGAERQVAYDSLVAAGYTPDAAAAAVARADEYFMGQLGLSYESPLRMPGNR